MRKKTALILGLCLLVLPSVYAQNGTEPIQTSDLLKMKTLSGIDISPDESRGVFAVTRLKSVKEGTVKEGTGPYNYNLFS
ncbi:hypothetical protein KGY73_10570 [bacterium]|nr:hypothetical protein [bacterium]